MTSCTPVAYQVLRDQDGDQKDVATDVNLPPYSQSAMATAVLPTGYMYVPKQEQQTNMVCLSEVA